MGEVVSMARGIGFGRRGARAGSFGLGVVYVALVWCLFVPRSVRAEPGFCTAVNLTDEGLVDTGEPCGQTSASDASTQVNLDTPHFAANSDPSNIALSGATNVFGVGLTALQNNPAGMAQVNQYAFSLGYGYHGEPENQAFTVATTDSLTNPHMAGGLMYSYQRLAAEIDGRETFGSAQRVRMGLTLSERWQNLALHLGSAAQFDKEAIGSVDRNLWNFDLGVLVSVFDVLRLGGVIHRVMEQSDEGRPSSVSGGIGILKGPVQVEYDVSGRMGASDEKLVSHAVGLQVAPYPRLPIRLGYRNQPSTDFQSVSGGVAYVFLQGAVDASYAQELEGVNRRWIAIQLRLFLGY